MIELQTVTTKAKNPSTDEFQDVTWGGINVVSTSGTTNYNNLTNKPTINGVTVQGSLTTGDLLITAADVGALPSGTKYGADFALSIDNQTFIITAQLKDQDGNNLGQAKTIDLPLETMVVGGSYDDTTQKVILTLKNGQTVEFSVADLISGLQSEITLNNKLDADLIDDINSKNKFVTSTEKSTWNDKQDTISDLATIRSGAAAGATAVQQTVFETDQQRQETEIGVVANAGSKNLLRISALSTTINNVAFTVNSDGTVTVNGQNTGSTSATFVIVPNADAVTIPDGNYILSGCPSGGGDPTYDLRWYRYSPNRSAYDRGTGAEVSKSGNTIDSNIAIVVKAGAIANNLVFKPMLRRAEITDSTYVPYAKTNRELTVENASQQSEINYAVNAGAKNNANFNFGGVVQDANVKPGTIVCVESNGTFSFSGTSDDKNYAAYVLKQFLLKAGTYKASGVSGGSNTTYWMRIGTGTNDTGLFNLYDAEREFNLASDTLITVQVVIYANQTVSNLVFKPMFRPASITDSTFQPYALPNPTLTPAAIKAVDEGAKNLLNLNTGFATYTNKGITYKNNSDGTIKVSGTSSSADSYITLYDRNTDSLFGIQKGETVVIRSTSDNVSVNLIYKKSGGGYGLTVYGYKSSPGWFTVPSDFVGFLLRIGVPRNGITVNEDVGGMICTTADYAVSPKVVPYCPTNRELYETKATMDDVYGYGNAITSNSNLNNYTNPGSYYCPNATVAGSLTNTPISNAGFRLVVESLTNTDERFIQTIHANGNDGAFYQRKQTSQGMSSWYKFEGTAVT